MSDFDAGYNLRQLKRMRVFLDDYEQGRVSLEALISNLDGLRSAAVGMRDWRKRFDPLWGVLEEVFAVMLDEGQADLDERGQELVNDAVTKMKDVVNNELVERGGDASKAD